MRVIHKVLIGVFALCGMGLGQPALANTPFIGEVAWVPYNFAPRGWAFCDGQLLAIGSNAALFSLLGTTYGGDGRTTFALPDVRSRTIMHEGQGPGLTQRRLGDRAGTEAVTLTEAEMPAHSHDQSASSGGATTSDPSGNALASTGRTRIYADAPNVGMNSGNIASSGGGQPHNNMQPYTVLNCIIALQGIFPPRN